MTSVGVMTDEVAVGSSLVLVNNSSRTLADTRSPSSGSGDLPQCLTTASLGDDHWAAGAGGGSGEIQYTTPAAAVAASVLAAVTTLFRDFQQTRSNFFSFLSHSNVDISSNNASEILRRAAASAQRRQFGIKVAIFVSVLLAIVLTVVRRSIRRILGQRAGARRGGEGANAMSDSNAPTNPALRVVLSSPPIETGIGTEDTRRRRSIPEDAVGTINSSNGHLAAGEERETTTRGGEIKSSQEQPSTTPIQKYDSNHAIPCTPLALNTAEGKPLSLSNGTRLAFSESPAVPTRPYASYSEGGGTASSSKQEEERGLHSFSSSSSSPPCLFSPKSDSQGGPMFREDTAEPPHSVAGARTVTEDAHQNRETDRRREKERGGTAAVVPLRSDQPLASKLKQQQATVGGDTATFSSHSSNGGSMADAGFAKKKSIRFVEEPTPPAAPLPHDELLSFLRAGAKKKNGHTNNTSTTPAIDNNFCISGAAASQDSTEQSCWSPTLKTNENEDSETDNTYKEVREEKEDAIITTKRVVNRFGALSSTGNMDSERGGGKPSRTRVGEGCAKRKERKAAEAEAEKKEAKAILDARQKQIQKTGGGSGDNTQSIPLLGKMGNTTDCTSHNTDPLCSPVAASTSSGHSFCSAPAIDTSDSPYSNIIALSNLPTNCTFPEFKDALVKQPSKPVMSLPDFVMLVGIPGSGKSTWAKEYILRMNAIADEQEERLREKERERRKKKDAKKNNADQKEDKASGTNSATTSSEGGKSSKTSSGNSSSSSSTKKSSSSGGDLPAKRYVLVSSDEVRRSLTGAIDDQTQNGLVWEVVLGLCQAHLRAGTSVVLDGTNVDTERRRKFVKRLLMGDRIRLQIENLSPVPVSQSPPSLCTAVAATVTAARDSADALQISASVSSEQREERQVPEGFTSTSSASHANENSNDNTSNLTPRQTHAKPTALLRKTSLSPNVGALRRAAFAHASAGISSTSAGVVMPETGASLAAALSSVAMKASELTGFNEATSASPNKPHTDESLGSPPTIDVTTPTTASSSSCQPSLGSLGVSPTTANSLLRRAEEILLTCGGCTVGLFAASTPLVPSSPVARSVQSATLQPDVSSNSLPYHQHGPIDCNRVIKIFTTNKVICKKRIQDDLKGGMTRSNVPPGVVDLMSTQLAEANGALQEERWIPMV